MTHNANAEWWRPTAARSPHRQGSIAAEGRDSAVPFAALMVFTGILLLSPQSWFPGLARLRIALFAGAVALGAYCWDRFVRREPLLRRTREMGLAAALMGWAVATIPLSEWPGGSMRILIDMYLKALLIFWLLSHTVNSLPRLRTVAWGLTLMAVPLAATGVWNFVHDVPYQMQFVKTSGQAVLLEGNRIAGYEAPLTGNPNGLALMLNLILPFTTALFLLNRRPAVRTFLGASMVLSAGAIILTFSRGGFLTLATSFFVSMWMLLKRNEWGWAVLALVVALALVPFLPSGYLDRLGTITDFQADPTGSAPQRWKDLWASLNFALTHPLTGAGLGMNFLALDNVRGPGFRLVHNVYLQYAVDLGWPGFGLFLFLFLGCIRSTARVSQRCAGVPKLAELSTMAWAIRIALIAFGVAAFFHPVAYHFYFYYLAALAVAVGSIFEKETRSIDPALPLPILDPATPDEMTRMATVARG